MSEKEITKTEKKEKENVAEAGKAGSEDKASEKPKEKKQDYFSIIRILQTDIPGNKRVLVGLTYIKGVSWSVCNAMCKILKIDSQKKIADLTEKEIETITEFLKNPTLPEFLLNRRKDFETGEDAHLIGTGLDMKKEFDIRRLKKIRSYRGLRHAFGHPTRGQRTRANFRSKKGKTAVGVKRKGNK
jgi:small subunit ribosomal protein S13